jgi:hypothetical protein
MGDVTLGCSDGKACSAGLVCCLTLDMSGGTAACAKSCMGSGGGPGGGGAYVLCSSDAECRMGEVCRKTRIPGIQACVPAGGGGGGAGPGGG